MQVRRTTPILEARQFTEVSAHGLIQDGWLKAWVCDSEGMKGNLTRSAGRTSDVRLGDWIVLEEMRDGATESEKVPYFRALSAEQFTEDFEVVPGEPGAWILNKGSVGNPEPGVPATGSILGGSSGTPSGAPSGSGVSFTVVVDPMPTQDELEEALIEAADAPKAKRAQG